MSIDRETLAAWIDGELNEIDARRVTKAVDADPALAAEVAGQRALKDRLARHFAPIVEAPVPERLTRLLTAEARVVPIRRSARVWPAWGAGLAIAASLVLGIGLGTRLPSGPLIERDGAIVASGPLARALETQLASAQGTSEVRMLVTFRDRAGAVCRGFETPSLAGIACNDGGRWQVRRTQTSAVGAAPEYRQAGSAETMAAAQDLAAGPAFDAQAERRARDAGWQ